MSNSGNITNAYKGAAVVIAAICSVFVAPWLWSHVENEAWQMLLNHYDHHTAKWLHNGLWAGCYVLTFYAIQLTIYTAVSTAVLIGALRFI